MIGAGLRKQLLIPSVLLLIVSCGTHAGPTPEELNAQAITIIQAGADERELKQVLDLTSQAIEKRNDYLPARNTRITALLQLGELEQVVEEAEAIASVDGNPENELYLCMAREAAQPGYPGQQACYSEVIDLMDKSGRSSASDANYLMAMKLANHSEFESAVWRYVENQDSEAAREVARFMFIEISRDNILSSYFAR